MDRANHASELPIFIQQLLDKCKEHNWKLDAIALSQGPGSYTGLRIGASTAKGLCYGLNIPLIPIDTLQVICMSMLAQMNQNRITLAEGAQLCPMLDARRMEVYTSIYSTNATRTRDIEAKIINEQSFLQELSRNTLYFFGNGAEKCKNTITAPNAIFIDNILPHAQYMGIIVKSHTTTSLDIKQLAYYEPFYLKEFVAAPSHIKGLETK
jgi:tRNA threonylcarbamoyladenosine biosynthesis protein TsaB